jgi:hypothetical protein
MRKESQARHDDGAFRRASYYLRPDQIRGLKMCAVLEDRRLSDVIRDAVDRYLRICASGEVRRQMKLS